MKFVVRPAVHSDYDALLRLRALLWPDMVAAENVDEVRGILAGVPRSTLPLTVFVAQKEDGTVIGFAEAGLRSHADGCDESVPVGYLEGWYVTETSRGQGAGRALVEAVVGWARGQGCRELASDTWTSNEASQCAHRALGFEEVDRCVNYRMPIT
jgi:aminoglycoside 6'-N-acetyltransferase I